MKNFDIHPAKATAIIVAFFLLCMAPLFFLSDKFQQQQAQLQPNELMGLTVCVLLLGVVFYLAVINGEGRTPIERLKYMGQSSRIRGVMGLVLLLNMVYLIVLAFSRDQQDKIEYIQEQWQVFAVGVIVIGYATISHFLRARRAKKASELLANDKTPR